MSNCITAKFMRDGINRMGALADVIDVKLQMEYGTGSTSITYDITRFHPHQIEFAIVDLENRGFRVLVTDFSDQETAKKKRMLTSKKKTLYVIWEDGL